MPFIGRCWHLGNLIRARILLLVYIELRPFYFIHFLSEYPLGRDVSTRKIAIIHRRRGFVILPSSLLQLCVIELILSGSEWSLIVIGSGNIMGHLGWSGCGGRLGVFLRVGTEAVQVAVFLTDFVEALVVAFVSHLRQ